MSWVPETDFEEEIVNSQPDHNFIYGHYSEPEPEVFYPRPRAHLEYAALQQRQRKQQQREKENPTKKSANPKLNIIAKVQRIAGTKPLGQQPTVDDWDDSEQVERETVAMIRHFGYGPSVEEQLDEKCTIATYPITTEMKVTKSGEKTMPILFDEKFFKLEPRSSNSNTSSDFDSPVETDNNSTSTDGLSNVKPMANSYSAGTEQSSESASASSPFESATEGEDSFISACNSNGKVPTMNFYRKGRGPQMKKGNNDKHANKKQPLPKGQFLTAKQLYEKKRHS